MNDKTKKISGVMTVLLMLAGGGVYLDYNNNPVKDYEVFCEQLVYEYQRVYLGDTTVFYNVSYIENITLINKTITYNYTEPVYQMTNTSYCPREKVTKIKIKGNKEVVYREGYTYSIKDNVLTMKDLNAGGTWNDRDLNSCWNPGVPCIQTDLDTLKVVKEFKDVGRKGVEKI